MNAAAFQLESAPPTELPISEIVIDPELMLRPLDQDTAEQYADAMRGGAIGFPPIQVVRYPDGTHVLVDGQTRLAAHLILKRKTIAVEIHEGDRFKALILAAGSNAEHGKPRDAETKRRAVLALYKQAEWKDKGARWIAEQCKVSPTFASGIMKTVHGGQLPPSTGKDGKVRKAPKKPKRQPFNVEREIKPIERLLDRLVKRWPVAERSALADLLDRRGKALRPAQPEGA